MADAWFGNVGIRVTDLERSIRFYTSFLDLEELVRAGDEMGVYVLFRDRRSGQRLEFNWYSDDSPFAAPYVPGEGLDHIEVRVKSVPEMVEHLKTLGIPLATKKLWVNRPAMERLKNDPEWKGAMDQEVWTTKTGHRVAYIQDPDGLFLAIYDHPEEPWDGPIPDHY